MKRVFKHALITGAGSGIGKSLCQKFTKNGTEVCAVDRYFGDDLSNHHKTLLVDVTSNELIIQLKNEAVEPFDIVIHCAAISAVGRLENLDVRSLNSVMDINLLAPVRITRDLISSQMVTATTTHVFVASMCCFTGYPGASVYAASKDGISAFARCLREAVRGTGGNVVTAYPGPTKTPHASCYSPDNSYENKRVAPDSVAHAIWTAASFNRPVAFSRLSDRFGAIVSTLFPSLSTELMAAWLLPKLDDNNAVYVDKYPQ